MITTGHHSTNSVQLKQLHLLPILHQLHLHLAPDTKATAEAVVAVVAAALAQVGAMAQVGLATFAQAVARHMVKAHVYMRQLIQMVGAQPHLIM
jgi:hypothetical protein